MAEEILLRYKLHNDLLFKGKNDHIIICRLDIEPSLQYRTDHQSVFCDICLVLDGSGSMNDPFGAGFSISKREGVMKAAKSIIPHLNTGDTVSLVFYDSSAYPIASCIPAIKNEEIAKQIDTLSKFSGATNFEAALKMTKVVLQNAKNASRRIFFLTDGNITHGDPKTIESIVQGFAKEGTPIDCLGAGSDFNFQYMRGLSAPSNGRTFLLKTPEEASKCFEELLVGAQKVIASNVFLTAIFPKGLRDIEAYQWLPEMRYYSNLNPGRDGDTRLEVNVQSIRQDKRNIYFLKANMDPPKTENNRLLAHVRLDFDLPPVRRTGLQEQLKIFVNFSDNDNSNLPDTTVEDGFHEVELVKLYEEFLAYRKDDWQKALKILEGMISRAEQYKDTSEGKARLKHYLECREKLKKDHNLSDDDLNIFGNASSQSTQSQEGNLEDPAEKKIFDSLSKL